MRIRTPLNGFRDIYQFYNKISGSHNGIINNKIYQINTVVGEAEFYAMTADFPNYERLFNLEHNVSYHLSGYGLSRDEALIRLIGESIERYSAVYAHESLPHTIYYYSYNQLRDRQVRVMDLNYLNVYDGKKNPTFSWVSDTDIIGWVKSQDIFTTEEFYIPAQLFYLGHLSRQNHLQEPKAFIGVSTGTAAHTSYKKALENALVEYLQIDSFILSWYAKDLKVKQVILDDEVKNFLMEHKLLTDQFEMLVLDFTLDKPFPVFGVFLLKDEYPFVSFGVQGGIDPHHTLYRGLLEAAAISQYNYLSVLYDPEKFELGHNKDNKFRDLDSNVIYWASGIEQKEKMNYLKSRIHGTVNINKYKQNADRSLLEVISKYCKDNNYNIGCLDITTAEVSDRDWYVIRTVIPELLPMCLPGIPFSEHPRIKEFGGHTYEFPHPLP